MKYTNEFKNEMVTAFRNCDCDEVTVNKFAYDNDLPARTFRRWLKEYNKNLEFDNLDSDVKSVLITCAQNNTNVDKKAWEILKAFAERKGAKIMVVPVRYKNVDAFHPEDNEGDEWWDPVLVPYLTKSNIKICDGLMLMANTKINATKANPLMGLDSISGKNSAIYGHAQVSMKTVPTPHWQQAKEMYTTGSVTKKNYTTTVAGSKAEFNHTVGALYVEFDKDFFCFQLLPDNKGVYFLDEYHTVDNQEKSNCSALVVADEHASQRDEGIVSTTFEQIVPLIRPEKLVRHDIYDHSSASHHHKKDIIHRMEKNMNSDDDVEKELIDTCQYLERTTPDWCVNYVVESNHNDHLRQWLNWFNPNSDIKNAPIYYHLMSLVSRSIKTTGKAISPLEAFLRKNCNVKSKYIYQNDKLIINDIDCSQHGDRGSNGARGSAKSFARSNYKMIIGHSHSPMIEKGVYQVGVNSLRMQKGYAKGYSSWAVAHCVIYPNGKRSLIFIKNNKYRA